MKRPRTGSVTPRAVQVTGLTIAPLFTGAQAGEASPRQYGRILIGQFEATVPPSTSKILPVTQDEAGEQR